MVRADDRQDAGGARSRRRSRPILWGVLVVLVALGLTVLWVRSAPRTAVPTGSGRPAGRTDLDDFVRSESAALNLPGVAVVVLQDGAPTYSSFVGTTESGFPVTQDTPFVLGSTSKQFTGLAIQRLIGEGRLSLDTLVVKILPELDSGTDGKGQVRVRDLLAQASGFSTTSGVRQWGWWPGQPGSIQENVTALARERLDRDPGSSFEYSNANYDLLGAIIERVTSEPYALALRELVLTPLGLTTTVGGSAAGEAGGYATWFGSLTVPTPFPSTPGFVASAGVSSSARDLTTLLQAHLGTVQTQFPPKVLAAARAPLTEVSQYAKYGSGWWVRPLWELHPRDDDALNPALPTCVEHEGDAYRSMSYLLACPATGFGVVMLTDVGEGTDSGRWTQFQRDLVHLALGTASHSLDRDLVQAEAPVVMLGSLAIQTALVVGLLLAVARRGRTLLPAVLAVVASVGALLLLWVYAPLATGAYTPLPSMWASAPDLALSTAVATVLAVVAVIGTIKALLARRSRRPAEVTPGSSSEAHP